MHCAPANDTGRSQCITSSRTDWLHSSPPASATTISLAVFSVDEFFARLAGNGIVNAVMSSARIAYFTGE
jgi:hypothetical protein